MTDKPKRPGDAMQLAHVIASIATVEVYNGRAAHRV